MAGNIDPIFPLTPKAAFGNISAANTAKDGTGVTVTVCTAGANGAFVEEVSFAPLGTNVATVARVFLNNGGSAAVAANNALWYEITLPVTALSEVSAQSRGVLPIGRAIPANYTLLITLGTAVAAGFKATCTWGDY